MSRDNSPTPKSSKYFFRPKREGDIAYLTERIHEIVHECQIVWLNILSEIRPNRDTEDDTDLEPAEITERLNKTGKFSHYFFIDNGSMGEGEYVHIQATVEPKLLTITSGHKSQTGYSEPDVITVEKHRRRRYNYWKMFGYNLEDLLHGYD